MAAALTEGKTIRAATDQFFCPTLVDDLVRAVMAVQKKALRGTLNLCAPEKTNRFALAQTLAQKLGAPGTLVEPISLYDIPAMKNRPLDTSMICSRLSQETDAAFLSLEEALETVAGHWRP